ncbi:MAG: hypothetical protein QOH96_1300 [Blastocatellia bacterium]|jgi:hypothetical protein|nr:hypothetical protein [Blastocatellia bacterium]
MTVELIGIIALAIGCLSSFFEAAFIVYAFFCATLLGSAAAFVLSSLGGTNISPAHLLLGFLAVRLLRDRRIYQQTIEAIAPGRPGFWLLLTVIYSAVSAYFFPRLFEAQTFVVVVRATDPFTYPLTPLMSNLTQSIYLIADCICFVVICGYAGGMDGKATLRNAAVLSVILNLIFAGLDLATYSTGTTDLMSFIRNANYSLLFEDQVGGMKRIVGSFIEASAFGAATLGYFAFSGTLCLLGFRPRLMFILSSFSLCALIFSTSSTAYGGLAVVLVLGYFAAFLAVVRGASTIQMNYFVITTPIILSVVFCVIALNEDYSTPIYNLLDTTVFNKFSTSSGLERSSWNRQALQVFIDTYGFGAGNGSMRTSSFPLAVIANLGIIGAVLFSLFFLGLFFGASGDGASDPSDNATRLAAKSACMAWLVTASISGSLTDLGMPFFAFAAIACAKPGRAYSNHGIDIWKYGERETPRNILNVASEKLSGWH